MKTTRRSFLKGIAGIVGVAAVSALPKTAQTDESIWYDAIPDSVLDMPVTVKDPLAWLEVDGYKLAITDGYPTVEVNRVAVVLDGEVVDYVAASRQWYMDCTLEDPDEDASFVHDQFRHTKPHDVRILPMGDSRIYSGEGFFTSLSTDIDMSGNVMVHATLVGVGELEVAS